MMKRSVGAKALSVVLVLAMAAMWMPMSVPPAYAEPSGFDFSGEWLPVGGVDPYVGYEMSAEEAAAIPVTVTASPSDPRRRTLPAQAVPGGIQYGYNWLADPANTGNNSTLLTGLYEAFVIYAEAAYASDKSYTLVNASTCHNGSINISSLNVPYGTDGLNLILLAYTSFRNDNPQYYMISSGYSYSYYPGGNFATFTPYFWSDYIDPVMRQAYQSRIEDKYREYAALGSTVTSEYDIVRLVHDKLLAERAYAYIGSSPDSNAYAHNILGVMDTSTNGPVCDSFSQAFSYILHRLNVGDAITIVGMARGSSFGSHAWSLVKIGGVYYYVDTTWDNRDDTRPSSSNYDYGGQVNDLYYKYFLVGSGNPDFGAGNSSSAIHWAAGPVVVSGNADRPYYGLPNNISVSDYTVPSGYKYLTDNGYYGKSTVTLADDYPYAIGKGSILMGTAVNSLEGNPLWVRTGASSYSWNRGPYHCGTFALGAEPVIRLYDWAFDSSQQYVNTMFRENGYVPLVQNVAYRVEVEPGDPGDTVRAWLYGIGEYRGIDFVMVTLSEPDPVAVSGLVKSYGPNNVTTLKLMRGDEEMYTTAIAASSGFGQLEQPFAFTGVASGTYSLVVTKPGHTSFTVQTVTVGNADLNLTQDSRDAVKVMTLLCGDINGDQMINDNDLIVLWQAANYNKSVGQAANPLCDLNGDGVINDNDLIILWLAVNYNKGPVVVA